MRKAYSRHAAFVAPARLRSGFGLLVIGYFAIEVLYRGSLELIDELILEFAPAGSLSSFYRGDTPLSLAAQLMSFAFLALSTILVVRLFHKRGMRSLVGPAGSTWRDFRAVVVPVVLLLALLEFVPPWWSADALESTRSVVPWMALLPLALFTIFVQISAEELLYRGYLQQQLAAVFSHPAAWLILTNLAFGLAHWQTGAGGGASFQYVLWSFVFGLVASDLTARAGNLGPAFAVHLANNAFAFLLYGERGGDASGYAFFLFPPQSMGTAFAGEGLDAYFTWQLALELLILGLIWLAARLGLQR